jgi:hypothetical protein
MDDSVALAELIARCDVITYEREDLPPAAIAEPARRGGEQRHASATPPLELPSRCSRTRRGRSAGYAGSAAGHAAPSEVIDGSSAAWARPGCRTAIGFPLVQKAPARRFRRSWRADSASHADDVALRGCLAGGNTALNSYAGDFREIAVLVVRGQRRRARAHFGPVVDELRARLLGARRGDGTGRGKTPATERRCGGPRPAGHRDHARYRGLRGRDSSSACPRRSADQRDLSPRVHNAGHYTSRSLREQRSSSSTCAPCADMPLSDTRA